MYLKKIELHGFKSFADKVNIEFQPGITGIVGPNGCGKSNISDAVRWVLGDQSVKSLRGSNMADVIFAGSQDRRAQNLAEVTLIFDNSDRMLNYDYNEVEITRRLYRQGNEAEYLLNRQQCRLKDITDLLLDTGLGRDSLSIISQGNISNFADSRPEERRVIFEEAAGVSKYKKRKMFVITLLVVTILIGISTKYVWNINIQIDSNMEMIGIEEDVKEAGLNVGMKKEKINVQEIANKIRLKRNDISWIGIELKGTNAIVRVVKAKEAPEIVDEKEYSNIIAKKSGVITKIIAQNGTAMVNIGDEVEENQILIAGQMEGKYTGIRNVHSLGEVEAIVKYSKTEKIPLKTIEKVATGKKETKYKLKISNFQINFYKTLSKFEIYDTIETEKKFKIFSNLYLPISITKITNQEQEKIEKSYTKEDAIQIGTKKLEKIIEDEIGTNKNIIDKKVDVIEIDNYIEVNVTYEIIENIGIQEKIE